MRNGLGILLISAAALIATPAAQILGAQELENRKTVLDGVFTAAQAERGKEAYAAHCSSCHMEDLQGLAAPALKGEQFMENWREDSTSEAFGFSCRVRNGEEAYSNFHSSPVLARQPAIVISANFGIGAGPSFPTNWMSPSPSVLNSFGPAGNVFTERMWVRMSI